MTIVFILLALLPALALAGPLLLGVVFDSEWILQVGGVFDGLAVALGAAAYWLVRTPSMESPAAPLGTRVATALGVGLVGFGLVFGAMTAWYLFSE
jgi:hypothetical protein